MVSILAVFFIKEGQEQAKVRQIYGVLCGVVGIVLNIILFTGKFIAGTLGNSIAITADAFNNLSDAGSSFVTLIGFKLAGQKPDTEHPFGHGRLEYLSGLLVSAAILLMAYELIRSSIEKIIHPEDTECSALIVAILIVSVLVKLYMASYNRSIGKKIGSASLRATATDSLSDACATTVVLISTIVGYFTGLHIDGICGVFVGIFIFYAGFSAAKDTLNPLLGQKPDEEFVKKIKEIVLSQEQICGIHDLIVHDYGPGRQMISLHAEVPADGNIIAIHDIIDQIENELRERLCCDATIHMDPIVTSDERVRNRKESVQEALKKVDKVLTMHDFRMVEGASHTNLIFDVVAPFKYQRTDEELAAEIQRQVTLDMGEMYFVIVKIDRTYV